MSRYIDADKLKYFGNHIGDEYEDRFHDAQWAYRSDIEDASSIDIIRCGECGHHKEKYVTFKGEKILCYRCMEFGIDIEADDFCSYGERSSE